MYVLFVRWSHDMEQCEIDVQLAATINKTKIPNEKYLN